MDKPLLAILIIISFQSFGQIDLKKIKDQAEIMGKGLLNDDYETLISFTYPNAVKMLGGKDSMISMMRKGKIEMAKQGVHLKEIRIGNASKATSSGNEIYSLVPEEIFAKVPGGTLKTRSVLLAVSKDGGEHWYFVDTVKLTMENVRLVVPDYTASLIIPKKKKPKFIRD